MYICNGILGGMCRQIQWQTYISHTIDRLYELLDVELFMLIAKLDMLAFIIMIMGIKIYEHTKMKPPFV